MKMTFDELNLAAAIVQAVREQGYETPTPIQAEAIPAVMAGQDLLAGAQTGTGKTAAFTLPILHRLSQAEAGKSRFGGKAIRALVLTPTPELAAQVEDSVKTYGKYLPLSSGVVFGGVGMNPQINMLKKGVDILVATPGRLLDLAQQGFLDLSQVEVLVLASAIRAIGAIPVFADVSARTLLIDPDHVESLVTERTRAILPVHLYGLIAPMRELLQIAERHTLRIIEDCAHAHGATLDGRHAGTFGDIGCFSFYPTKNIGALGDAGLCLTQNAELAEKLRRLRMYGFDRERIALSDGLNSRLDELQACILRVRLKHFSHNTAAAV